MSHPGLPAPAPPPPRSQTAADTAPAPGTQGPAAASARPLRRRHAARAVTVANNTHTPQVWCAACRPAHAAQLLGIGAGTGSSAIVCACIEGDGLEEEPKVLAAAGADVPEVVGAAHLGTAVEEQQGERL